MFFLNSKPLVSLILRGEFSLVASNEPAAASVIVIVLIAVPPSTMFTVSATVVDVLPPTMLANLYVPAVRTESIGSIVTLPSPSSVSSTSSGRFT